MGRFRDNFNAHYERLKGAPRRNRARPASLVAPAAERVVVQEILVSKKEPLNAALLVAAIVGWGAFLASVLL